MDNNKTFFVIDRINQTFNSNSNQSINIYNNYRQHPDKIVPLIPEIEPEDNGGEPPTASNSVQKSVPIIQQDPLL